MFDVRHYMFRFFEGVNVFEISMDVGTSNILAIYLISKWLTAYCNFNYVGKYQILYSKVFFLLIINLRNFDTVCMDINKELGFFLNVSLVFFK